MKNNYLLSFLIFWLAATGLRAQQSCLSFFADSQGGSPGDTVAIGIRANSFEDILTFSFSLQWDPAQLRLIAPKDFNLPGLLPTSFNLDSTQNAQGSSSVVWYDPALDGLTVADSSLLFSLQFEVLAGAGEFAPLRFGREPTSIEFTNGDSEILRNYSLLGGGVGVGLSEYPSWSGSCIDNSGCADGNSISLQTAGNGLVYDWRMGESSIATSDTLSDVSPGNYECRLSDAAGATLTGLFSVTTPQGVFISSVNGIPASSCDGTGGSLSLILGGGSGDYSISWSNGSTGSLLTGLDPGIYSVTVTDNIEGCTFQSAYQVLGVDTGNFVTAFSQECTLFPPDSATVDLTCVVWDGGQAPYIFEWNTGFVETDSLSSTLADAPGDGVYSVTITDVNGCVYSPDPVTTDCGPADTDDCDFNTAASYACTLFADGTSLANVDVVVWEGGSPPYVFEWSTGFTDTSSMQSTLSNVPGQGAYSVTITDSDTCSYVVENIQVDCSDNPQNALLSAAETTAQPGGQVCVDISLNTLADFTALQANISWEGSVLTFDRLEGAALSFVDEQIDTTGLGDALLSIDWATDVPEGVIMNGETVLFQLCFDVVGSPGSISGLNFFGNNQFTLLSGDNIALNTDNGAVFVQGDGSELSLSFGEKSVNSGEAVCLPVTARNFNDILSMQFSADWNPDMLAFDSLETAELPGLSDVLGINYNIPEDGKLTFAWIGPNLQAATLPDDAVLFELCFTATGSSGTAPVSFSNAPTPVEIGNEQFMLPVVLTNGVVYLQQGDIWPGDTDVNQVVQPEDLLPIGLAFGAAGPPRPNASISWTAQFGEVWDQRTPASNIDYKHIDTNGDGFIDEADTLAIVQNMGLETNLLPPADGGEVRANGAPLYVQPDSVVLGEPATFDIILGESSLPANDVYGVAFTIVYDSAAVVPASARAGFAPSWLGVEDAGLLTLYRNRPAQSRIDVAMTRTDGLNQSGQGTIGQLHVTIQDVIFLRGEVYEMEFRIENVRIISVSEEELPVTTPATVSIVEDKLTKTQEARDAIRLSVFPVPARDQLWVRSASPVEQLALLSADGRTMLQQGPAEVIDVSALPAGWYTLRVWTKDGVVHRPVVIE